MFQFISDSVPIIVIHYTAYLFNEAMRRSYFVADNADSEPAAIMQAQMWY